MSIAAWAAAAAAACLIAAVVHAQRAIGARPAGAAPGAGPPLWASGVLARARTLPGGTAGHLVSAALGASGALLVVSPLPAVVLGVLAGVVSLGRARRREDAARRARERATSMFARSLADALRGGMSVRGALAEVAEDRSVPALLRQELVTITAGVRRGASLQQALWQLAALGGPGLRLTCGTIAMHVDAGGALARELERLAARAEAAQRVDEERGAATAQARATVRVVSALPVIALVGAELTSGNFLSRIAGSTAALALLIAGLVLELLAVVAARAIVAGRR